MVEHVERRQFDHYIIVELRRVYRGVVKKIMKLFKENKVDIKELIILLQFDDVRSVYSTDDAFKNITTVDDLFGHVSQYCKSIYDYQVLDDIVQTSECPEAIKELNNFTELLKNSILAQLNLVSGHGGFLNPDDFMPGTYRFVIEYEGGNCTIETKKMIESIVLQSVRLKNGMLIFKGVGIGSILFIYQISETIKNYLLHYKLTKQDLAFLEGNQIVSLKVDDVCIMHLSKLDEVQPTRLSLKVYDIWIMCLSQLNEVQTKLTLKVDNISTMCSSLLKKVHNNCYFKVFVISFAIGPKSTRQFFWWISFSNYHELPIGYLRKIVFQTVGFLIVSVFLLDYTSIV